MHIRLQIAIDHAHSSNIFDTVDKIADVIVSDRDFELRSIHAFVERDEIVVHAEKDAS